MKIHKGEIVWFNPDLGYGYIAIAPSLKRQLGLPSHKDLYVHKSGAEDYLTKSELKTGDRVLFEVGHEGGPRAVAVRLDPDHAHVPYPEHGVDVEREPIPS